MKRINIISETIYKGKHKLVNQGAFINMSDLVGDIFSCFGIPCCDNKADYFIRKSALIYGRKKPGANWTSLNKLVLDVYNCCKNTSLCPGSRSAQWWITTDVIRPIKTIETINFTNIIDKVLNCCGLTECGCPDSFNFDITADWSLVGTVPVANQASFEDWLINDLGATSVVINSFELTGNRLQANITVEGVVSLSLPSKNVTLVNKIGGFDSSLSTIVLAGNNLTSFNPNIPLPSGLEELHLTSNQIVNFNPSIALPTSLTLLALGDNQIITFNPTLSLSSSLNRLFLNGNQIVIFNPSNELPISLIELDLSSNQMTTAGYTASEPWANAQNIFTSNNTVNFASNPDQITLTNLETILLSKNCIIVP